MPSLSVIMIVKNEAAVLAECLQSVAGIADEIVIGDTGSTDGTAAVAAEFGARFHEIGWNDDFAAARNETIRLAWGEWLLHMDADEVLDPDSAAEVRAIVDADTESDAVEVILANYCNDPRAWRWVAADPESPHSKGYSGYLPVGLLRLFRNRRGIEYRESVHENITASIHEIGGAIRPSSILIHHYGYEGPADRRREKARFYLELARQKAARNPGDVKCLHDLAEQALGCGEEREAERACERALALDADHVGAATTLANIYLNRADTESAHDLLCRLEQAGHTHPHIQTALGAIAVHRGEWGEACARLERARRESPPAPVATLYLARALDYHGEGDAAMDVLNALARAVPGLDEARRRVRALKLRWEAEELFAGGDAEGALKLLVDSLHEDGEDALAHNDTGVVLHALGENNRARDAFYRALQLAPGLTEARENLEAF